MDFDTSASVFGKWSVVHSLGSGSFGTVYKIKKEEAGVTSLSALKVIQIPQNKSEILSVRHELGDDQSVQEYYHSFAEDFSKEIRMMSILKGNSNIVSFEDYDLLPTDDGFGWTILIRMELLTPFPEHQSSHSVTEAEIVQLGIDICRALEMCEMHHIIHRDIKPDNIFVTDIGTFKLGDFGIARELEKTTGGLSKKGSYSYMAPEVYLGQDYDHTVDIYSLGIVLYKLLNKNRGPFLPFAPAPITYSERERALEERIKGTEMPDIPYVSGQLNKIIKKACSFTPASRYQSAADMKIALIKYSQGVKNNTEKKPREEKKHGDKTTEKRNDIKPTEKKTVSKQLILIAILIVVLTVGILVLAILKKHYESLIIPTIDSVSVVSDNLQQLSLEQKTYYVLSDVSDFGSVNNCLSD